MPLHRRLPKRGFTNIFREEFSVVNLATLVRLGEKIINPEVLQKAGLASAKRRVKILGEAS